MGVLDMGSFNLITFADGQFGETVYMPLDASVYQNPFRSFQFMLQYYADHDLIPNLAVYVAIFAVFVSCAGRDPQRALVKLFSASTSNTAAADREGSGLRAHDRSVRGRRG